MILESVTEEILERDFKRVALAVKRKRVEEGLEEGVPVGISEPALKRLKMDVPTSMDGSWKHKIQSNHGLVAAISADTGMVLDRHYMTKGKLMLVKVRYFFKIWYRTCIMRRQTYTATFSKNCIYRFPQLTYFMS